MTDQLDLLTQSTNIATGLTTTRPLSRTGDPAPSHEASEVLVASGKHATDCLRVLGALHALRDAAPPTYRELAAAIGMEPHAVWKRLADLLNGGYAAKVGKRQCQVGVRQAATWAIMYRGQRAIWNNLPLDIPRPSRRRADAA